MNPALKRLALAAFGGVTSAIIMYSLALLLTSFPETVFTASMWGGFISGFVVVLMWFKMADATRAQPKGLKWWLEAMLWAGFQTFIAGIAGVLADSWGHGGIFSADVIAEMFVFGLQMVGVGLYSLYVPLIGPLWLRWVRHLAVRYNLLEPAI